VTVVLGALTVIVAAVFVGGAADNDNLGSDLPHGVWGVLRSAALLFFAFAGYARLATLGEEVRDPEVTIPRAVPLALGVTIVIYFTVLGSALLAVGPQTLAGSSAPLAAAVEAGSWSWAVPLVRVGASVAAAGVLLSLLAGISRTALSMARRDELPRYLDAVHPRFRTPHRAEVSAAVIVCAVVAVADLRDAIGFSSFAVLTYYALANASAWTLSKDERRWPRWISALGLTLCVLLAFTLPLDAVIGGIALLATGSVVWLATRSQRLHS
jgi:APA family basic amino acid/polyamine antiporter